MKDLYLIDGYNVIFRLPKLFNRNELESSRKRLIDMMEDYGAHNNVEIIIVFDGQGETNAVRAETISPSFSIVFTPTKMTADSYIEKESYKRKDEYRLIYVVTSDGPEQSQVLGNGAYRMAVNDLVKVLKEDKATQSDFIKDNNLRHMRSEIGDAIPQTVQEKLNALRLKKSRS